MDFCSLLLSSLIPTSTSSDKWFFRQLNGRKKIYNVVLNICRLFIDSPSHGRRAVPYLRDGLFFTPNWLLVVQCVFIIGVWDLEAIVAAQWHGGSSWKRNFNWTSLLRCIFSTLVHLLDYIPPRTVYVRKNSTSSSKYIHQLYLLHNGYLISVKRFTLSRLRIAKLAAKENRETKMKIDV